LVKFNILSGLSAQYYLTWGIFPRIEKISILRKILQLEEISPA
jgi:hypothetical protein